MSKFTYAERQMMVNLLGTPQGQKFIDLLQGRLDDHKNEIGELVGDVEVRWMQGKIQELDEVLGTVNSARETLTRDLTKRPTGPV